MLLQTIILSVAVLGVAMFLIGIRVFIIKDGAFKGGCATNNPMLTNQIGECQVCGRMPGEECKGDEVAA